MSASTDSYVTATTTTSIIPTPAAASSSRSHQQLQAAPSSSIGARYDETQFFDRVKRALVNREPYNEFLKLVNLFVQDIIDTSTLIQKAVPFLLPDSELMVQFKEILGWDERRERYAGTEDVWTRPTGVLDRPNRNQLNLRFGSYRKLPGNVSVVDPAYVAHSVMINLTSL